MNFEFLQKSIHPKNITLQDEQKWLYRPTWYIVVRIECKFLKNLKISKFQKFLKEIKIAIYNMEIEASNK